MIKKYKTEYNFQTIAVVEIDSEKASEALKEMVEFWIDWEWNLEQEDGDYEKTFLKNLTNFIIREGRVPKNDEGWCPLDGSHGIKIVKWEPLDIDRDEINITTE